MQLVDDILEFWFAGDFNSRRKEWFVKDAAFDDEIRSRFGDAVEQAGAGELDDWLAEPESALALVILLDQFPRNLFRGDAKTFAFDEKALAVAKTAVAKGFDTPLTVFQKIFFYLPYEHSENLEDQFTSVRLIAATGDDDYLKYAIAHYNIIDKFGRYPHRNEVLGRESTAEELAFMEEFGGF